MELGTLLLTPIFETTFDKGVRFGRFLRRSQVCGKFTSLWIAFILRFGITWPQPTRALIDVFEAINFTEAQALAQHNPSQPMLPEPLIQGLSFVFSRDVQRVMSLTGVRSFLQMLARTSDIILNSHTTPEDRCEKVILYS